MHSKLSRNNIAEIAIFDSQSVSEKAGDNETSEDRFLICQSAELRFALAVETVIEIMRPLPLRSLRDPAPFLLGVSIIRGVTVPVIDIGVLLSGNPIAQPSRLVMTQAGEHQIALAVDTVLGIQAIPHSVLRQMPELVSISDSRSIAAIGVLDGAFLLLLQAALVVPDAMWESLRGADEAL